MIIKYERTTAYICPFCSNLTKKKISAFDFSGRDHKPLLCSTPGCREECAKITVKNDKYKISVECPICGDAHTFSVPSAKFWNKKLLMYKCPVSGIDIIFFGEEDTVEKTVTERSVDYTSILPDYDDNSEESEMLYEILDCVHELRDKHKISCLCGSESVSIQVINNCLVLVCDKCGRLRVIETNEHNLAMLLNAEAIVIGN